MSWSRLIAWNIDAGLNYMCATRWQLIIQFTHQRVLLTLIPADETTREVPFLSLPCSSRIPFSPAWTLHTDLMNKWSLIAIIRYSCIEISSIKAYRSRGRFLFGQVSLVQYLASALIIRSRHHATSHFRRGSLQWLS